MEPPQNGESRGRGRLQRRRRVRGHGRYRGDRIELQSTQLSKNESSAESNRLSQNGYKHRDSEDNLPHSLLSTEVPLTILHELTGGHLYGQRGRLRTRAPYDGRGGRGRRRRRGGRGGQPGQGRGRRNFVRAVVDSDASSGSIDSDIAEDYVRNVLHDSEEIKECESVDPPEESNIDRLEDTEAIAGLVQYSSQAQHSLLVSSGQIEDEEIEMTDIILPEASSKRGRRLAHETEKKHASLKQGSSNSLYGKPIVGGKGFNMLRKLGWTEGDGLGKNCEGRKEPINVKFNHTRRGLG